MALKVGELFATLDLDDSAFDSGLSKAASGAGKIFSKGLKGITAATAAMTTAVAATGAAAMKSIIDTGSSFEAAMSEVQAISGATGEELESLTETAKHYGETTAFTASQAAEALKYMALAGWDATQSAEALPGVLNLAAASGMDLATASDMVTDYISAFGMECSDATYLADMMAKAQATSNTSAQQLGEAYGNCAATLHAAGQDVETVSSLLMTMANQGLKGSEAGTALSAVMRDITAKMENGAISIGKTSVKVQDAQGNFRDLTDILRDVQAATEGMGSAEKSAALMSTFTARSLKGINLILNEGVDAAAAYETSLRNATGTGSEQAATMLDNLQGDIKLFQSALEGLQIDAYDSMNGMMRDAVQGATTVISELQAAFQNGFSASSLEGVLDSVFDLVDDVGGQITDMLVNLSDAFTSVLPKLLKNITKGLSDIMGKIGKQMPKLAKNLFSALPDVVKSAGQLIPSLADSLFEAVGAAIEQVIGDLPELVPALIEGFGNLFESVGDGLVKIITSIFNGAWTALGKMGLRRLTLDEALQKQIDNVDTSGVEKVIDGGLLTYEFDVEVDPGEYQQKINTAVQNIHNALLNVPELSESERSAIEEALISGSGADVLSSVISTLDIPDPEGTASKLTEAFNTIDSALVGLELSAEAKAAINEVASSGGDVKAALMSYGVPEGTATEVANQLTSSWSTVSDTLTDLGLDAEDITTLRANAGADRRSIIAALQLLKFTPEQINALIPDIDIANSTLTARFSNVIDDIGAALTNGIPDDPEKDPDLKQAKTDLETYIQTAYDKLVEWRDAKLNELETSGLTGEVLQTEVDKVNSEFEELSGNLDSLSKQTTTWIDENAGQATSVVQQHMGELDEIAAQADALNARIDALGVSLESGGALNRTAVEQGLVSDQSGQIEAMNYSQQELQSRLDKYRQDSAAALEKASQDFAGDAEGYAAERSRIMTDLEGKETEAYTSYQEHMQRIFTGIISTQPELAEQLFSFQDSKFGSLAGKLRQGISDAIDEAANGGEKIDANKLLENLEFTEADISGLAEKLNIDPQTLIDKINQSLEQGFEAGQSTNNWFEQMLTDYFNESLQGLDLAEAIDTGALDVSGIVAMVQAAVESGLMTLPEGMDVTSYVKQMLSNLTYDENGELVLPPITVTPSDPPAELEGGEEGLQSEINETVDNSVPDSVDGKTVTTDIDVDANVSNPDEVSAEAEAAVDEATSGVPDSAPEKTVEQPLTVDANVTNDPSGDAATEVETAAGTVSEEAPTKTVDMKMDLNASVGSISFSEGNSVTDRLQELFTDETIPMTVNIDITKGTFTFAEDFFTTADLQTEINTRFGGEEGAVEPVDLPADISVTPGTVALAEGTDIASTVSGLMPALDAIPVSADISFTPGSVTLAGDTDIASAVSGLLPDISAIPISADISFTPGSVTLTEGTDIAASVAALMPVIGAIPLSADASVTLGTVSLAGDTDVASTVAALIPAPGSIPLSADASVDIASVTLAGNLDLTSAVTALMPDIGTIPLSADATVTLSITSSNAASLGLGEGTELGSAVAEGLQGTSGAVESAAAAVVNATIAQLRSAISEFDAEGDAFANAVASGLRSGSGTAGSAAAALASAAAAALRGTVSSFTSAGKSFASGLASGIRSGRSAVVNAAAEVAAAAASAARSALQIHSPSKVTQGFGAMFDQGFAIGIDREAFTVIRSAGNLATMAANAATVGRLTPHLGLSGGREGGQTVVEIDYDALADAMNQRQMVLSMKDRTVAEVLTDETARTQSRRSRRVALGYGK